MIIKRLLKSWATPPVSWPSASNFWDLGELLLHRLEPELRVAALGDVARDLGEADQLAVLVDRIDHHARPEEGAVLADAPAFFLVAALFPCDAERAGGLAIRPVGLGIETGKMLADDLFRANSP